MSQVLAFLIAVVLAPFRAFLYLWNNQTNPWYFDIRLDKYIFLVFSWVVWAGFMRRYGAVLMAYVGATLEGYVLPPVFRPLARFFATAAETARRPFATQPAFLPTLDAPAPVAPALANPGADIDLSVTTDCEDLAAFASDVVEFMEQDRALLLDSLTDFGALGALGVALGGLRVLSARYLKRKR